MTTIHTSTTSMTKLNAAERCFARMTHDYGVGVAKAVAYAYLQMRDEALSKSHKPTRVHRDINGNVCMHTDVSENFPFVEDLSKIVYNDVSPQTNNANVRDDFEAILSGLY